MAFTWQAPDIKAINEGTRPNDGTGDSIREAFITVENNFANIAAFFNGAQSSAGADYSTGSKFAALEIINLNNTTSNIGNLTVANVVSQSRFYSNINMSANIVPTSSGAYDLGSASNPFRNLYVQATVSTSTVATSSDAGLLQVHANATPGDIKDVGIFGNVYHSYGSNTYAFFGFQKSTNNFIYKITPTDATLGNSVVTDGVFGNVRFGSMLLSNVTPSTSNITGALIVSGGVGVNQDVNVKGNIYTTGYRVLNTSDVSTLGYPTYSGAGSLFLGNTVFATTTPSTSVNTGAVVIKGGLGVEGNITAGGLVGNYYGNIRTENQPYITGLGTLGNLTVAGTTSTQTLQATSIGATGITSGALTVTGAIVTATLNATNNIVTQTITAGTIGNTGANIVGTIGTASQPTITTLGNLTNLSVAGNVSVVSNIAAGNLSVTNTTNVNRLNAAGNLHVTGGILTLSADNTAVPFVTSGSLTNALFVASKSVNNFVQVSAHNANSGVSASTDFIAYANNGTNTQGFIDMGIASSGFNDPTYGVTKAGDGYIFVSAPTGTGGNLVLATADGTHNDIVFAAGGFFDGTEQGRFVTGDGLYLTGNLIATTGTVYQGEGAKSLEIDNYFFPGYTGLTNASGIFVGNEDAFVQLAMRNHSAGPSASTDLIAYSSNGDNNSGWVDIGITSENYSDTTYGVTGPHDGYVFMSAPVGSTGNGDLYISTSDNGAANDIVFSTNGFQSGTERMRIIGQDRPGKPAGVEVYITTESTSTTTGALRVNGGMGLRGNLNVAGNVSIVGNLTFGGNGTTTSTSTLIVEAPINFLANSNPSNNQDIGIVGQYVSSGTKYTGVLRQASTGSWRFFDGETTKPTTTAAFSGVGSDVMMGSANIANITPSTSTTTGALRVAGGLGLAGTMYIGGSIIPSGNIVSNIGSPSAWFNTIHGVSTQAKYADLAEIYVADNDYAPGTVVVFGGEKEITVTNEFADARVAGAISTDPAYLMNAAETGLPVALRGRVPVNVIGPVTKGDSLVTCGANPGYAISIGTDKSQGQAVFAKSLETDLSEGKKTITAVIL